MAMRTRNALLSLSLAAAGVFAGDSGRSTAPLPVPLVITEAEPPPAYVASCFESDIRTKAPEKTYTNISSFFETRNSAGMITHTVMKTTDGQAIHKGANIKCEFAPVTPSHDPPRFRRVSPDELLRPSHDSLPVPV
jgi:hypothetical protein